MIRTLILILPALTALAGFGSRALAAELLMIEQEGCPWCERFHREIGTAYPKTAEGAVAPLRLVDLHEPIPEELSHLNIQKFTPVFILVNDEMQEIDRIVGYPGDNWFWLRLGEMLEKLH